MKRSSATRTALILILTLALSIGIGAALNRIHAVPGLTAAAVSSVNTEDEIIPRCKSVSEAAQVIREGMKNRAATQYLFLITDIPGDKSKPVLDQVFAGAVAHTGIPTEGDYIMFQYDRWYARAESVTYLGDSGLMMRYDITYLTTAEQEAAVDRKVRQILSDLALDGLSDEEKVDRIYRYVCSNVSFDYEHENQSDYDRMYTAYAALVEGKAICQGYSLALYRLLLEAGIDSRVIVGKEIRPGKPDVNHVWNIVGLDGVYYNLDATWDSTGYYQEYYLKTDSEFTIDHVRTEEYLTDEFRSQYPTA